MADALKHLQSEESISRLGFIHVPPAARSVGSKASFSTPLYQLLSASALQTLSPSDLLGLVEEIRADPAEKKVDTDGRIQGDSSQRVLEGSPLHAFTSAGWTAADQAAAAEFWRVGTDIAKSLSIRAGQTHLLVNGRVSAVRSFS